MTISQQIMDFNQYTKKPVAIRAAALNLDVWYALRRLPNRVLKVSGHEVEACLDKDSEDKYFTIDTLEGKMKAKIGDMLIIGVRGEIYACDKEIFDQTYDKAVL